jgi:hypothetical protein
MWYARGNLGPFLLGGYLFSEFFIDPCSSTKMEENSMTVQFSKRIGEIEWEIRSGPFQLWWTLYWVSGKKRLWVALFRELPMLDAFISIYEHQSPIPSGIQAIGGTNPYMENAIAEFQADEIDEAQFIETAHVYGALPDQIRYVIEQKNATQGFHSE